MKRASLEEAPTGTALARRTRLERGGIAMALAWVPGTELAASHAEIVAGARRIQ
jgi:hypothetical protein